MAAEQQAESTPEVVEVYWRPGCPYCSRLLRVLDDAAVRVRLHNIWEDDDARAFVRAHNDGNETVPTVAVGTSVATNPDPARFVAHLREQHGHLLGAR